MMQDWFKKAKLGIFIHYGIYAVDGVSESWSFHNGLVSYEDYMAQKEGFTAKNFDADKWADLIKKSGARYAVLTSKHHDGFCLWDTDTTDHSVMATPAKKDIIDLYTRALREKDIKVGLYYSLTDWSRPDYRSIYRDDVKPENYENQNPFETPAGGEPDYEAWQRHLDFNNEQMKELMTRYGDIDLLWFDGDWERSAEQWKMPSFVEYLHELNPEVVLNSRLQGYGDYATPEQGIPIYSPEGPWEFCITVNSSWGFRHMDQNWKSTREIMRMFVDCLTLGGNMLLDVGPMEDGTIPEPAVKILEELGAWINIHEEAIYDTGRGVGFEYFLGGSTLSDDKKTLYLFVYDPPADGVLLKGLIPGVESIEILHSGKQLPHKISGGAPWNGIPGMLWIPLAAEDCCEFGPTVLKLQLDDTLSLYQGHGQAISFNE